MFSFPIRNTDKGYEIVKNLELSSFAKEKIAATLKELEEEKAAVKDLA